MQTIKQSSSLGAFLACAFFLPAALSADTTYAITIDTSFINSESGYLDLQLEPGLAAVNLTTAVVSSFATDSTLNGAGQITGDVGGQLPGQLQFDNQTAFNDYFQGIQMFGNQVSFNLDLNGPTPLGGDSSGFNIAFYADDGSTPLLTNSPDGIVAQFVVNPDGSISPTTFPIADDIPENVVSYQIATTPEPRKLTWLGLLLFTGVFWLRRRQGTRWQHRS